MRYYIIAGEASGDLHGANLVKAIQKTDAEASFQGVGGQLLADAGVRVGIPLEKLAFMGFVEVIKHLKTIRQNFAWVKADILRFKPDVVILIDYPGFNLRMARFAATQGIKVVYYISPQVWAWKANRVQQIKKYVDRMLVILPFEKEFYARYQYTVHFVGHPLLDALQGLTENKDTHPMGSQPPVIALLPGSRQQEIKRNLPVMLETAALHPEWKFVIAAAPSLNADFYRQFELPPQVSCVHNQTYAVLQQAQAALVTSGTATLETALLGVPQVVCYRGSALSVWLAKRLIKVPYISLVNLIMNKPVVTERIQENCHARQLSSDLLLLLQESKRKEVAKNYAELTVQLGGAGASGRAAEHIQKLLQA